jgi:uncharacterized membrane protein YuzA (DUF378 family)
MLKMNSKVRLAIGISGVYSILLFSLSSSAQAAPRTDDILNLNSPPLVIEVGGPGLGDYENTKTYTRKVNLLEGQSGYLDYSVEGPIPATLSVEMVDLGVDAGGNKIPVPLNSTKFGLRGIVKPVLDKTTYIPNGKIQKYRVKLTNLVGSLEGVRLGGVKVNLIPQESSKPGSKSINMVSAIVVSVGAIQYGFDMTEFNAQAKIKGSDLRFVPVRRSGILGLIDYIPDIPFVIDHGPADWSISILNVGIQPLEQFMRWRIVKGRDIPYTDDVKKYRYVYASENGSHLTIPDQKFTERTRTVILKNTEVQSDLRAYAKPTEVNALPLFGFITADAQVHTSFGAFKGKTQHFSRTYLIFPWKEVLLIILTYLGYRKARRKIKKARKERAERKLAEAETAAAEAMASLSPDQPARAKRSITKTAAAKKTTKKVARKSPAKQTTVKKAAVKKTTKKVAKKSPAKKAAAK